MPGTTGTPASDRDAARRDFVAERRHHLGRWPDENHPGLGDSARELGTLGKKAVAGMNRVGAGGLRAASMIAAMLR